MKIFICLDDNNGMMFNGRRQSRDEAVVKDILDFAGEEKVWESSYKPRKNFARGQYLERHFDTWILFYGRCSFKII